MTKHHLTKALKMTRHVVVLYLALTVIVWLFRQNPMRMEYWQLPAWIIVYLVCCAIAFGSLVAAVKIGIEKP